MEQQDFRGCIFFYHYTSKKNCESMTQGKEMGGWTCEERQPQKSSWYSEQHQKGFYVTCMSPRQITARAARKTGGGVSDSTHVLVFALQVSEKGLKDRVGVVLRSGNSKITHVGSPGKYCINKYNSKGGDDIITFSPLECVFAGDVERMPVPYENDDKVVERMVAQAPPK